MDGLLGQSDGLIRLLVFAAMFLLMAAIELLRPKRRLSVSKAQRWITNLAIAGVDTLVLRVMAALAVPAAAVAAAFFAKERGLGLLNQVDWPHWIKLVIALLVLDLAIWFQHLVSHKVPIFWRLHQVHHADRDIDVTTAVRFHPVEIALSMLWKITVVIPLGASPFAVFLFEVILNACAMFNHANIALPPWLDRILRVFIVTPDMHRVHHSVLLSEHDRNYGFNLSLWDRLFGTYLAQPEVGHQGMTIGLTPYQSEAPTRFGWSLLLPFWREQQRND
jgi:sterol desaturase/sphingolipid hydroxylase (fatty acid hydroxylase superfamily)